MAINTNSKQCRSQLFICFTGMTLNQACEQFSVADSECVTGMQSKPC